MCAASTHAEAVSHTPVRTANLSQTRVFNKPSNYSKIFARVLVSNLINHFLSTHRAQIKR